MEEIQNEPEPTFEPMGPTRCTTDVKLLGDLAKRLAHAMSLCTNLDELGTNGGKDAFKYVKIGQIVDVGRRAMAEAGLTLFFDILEHYQKQVGKTSYGNPILETTLVVDVTMIAAESGAWKITRQCATARDFSDKGVNKALSQAMKNYYMKTLGISSSAEDEVDQHDIQGHRDDQSHRGRGNGKKSQDAKRANLPAKEDLKEEITLDQASKRFDAVVGAVAPDIRNAFEIAIKAHFKADDFKNLTPVQIAVWDSGTRKLGELSTNNEHGFSDRENRMLKSIENSLGKEVRDEIVDRLSGAPTPDNQDVEADVIRDETGSANIANVDPANVERNAKDGVTITAQYDVEEVVTPLVDEPEADPDAPVTEAQRNQLRRLLKTKNRAEEFESYHTELNGGMNCGILESEIAHLQSLANFDARELYLEESKERAVELMAQRESMFAESEGAP